MLPSDIEPAPPGWARYYFTLGVQYNRLPHPRLRATGEDVIYVTIPATETNDPEVLYANARAKWAELLTPKYQGLWSNQYSYEQICESAEFFLGQCVPVEQVLWEDLPDESF